MKVRVTIIENGLDVVYCDLLILLQLAALYGHAHPRVSGLRPGMQIRIAAITDDAAKKIDEVIAVPTPEEIDD